MSLEVQIEEEDCNINFNVFEEKTLNIFKFQTPYFRHFLIKLNNF
jgi:hypothetical protein